MDASSLDVNLMGPPEISLGGAQIEVDTRKAIALLAYLAVQRSATRDTLATLLWGESDDARARAALRRTLSALRSAIGADRLDTDRFQVTLLSHQGTDVTRFRACLTRIKSHPHDPAEVCADCIPDLEDATTLYRGDFLQGFAVRDAPDFEGWVRTIAEELRLRAGEALDRLASARAAGGDYTGAMSAAMRWIELDPLHEPAYRQLMLFHAWAGDRPGAIEAYRRCVATLGEELGVTPLEETTELYEAILDEDLPRAPATRRRALVSAVPTQAQAPSDLIDRADQVALLRERLDGSSAAGAVVVVTGEPWMGKTRLVEEFLRTLDHGEGTIVRGRGFRGESSLPYGVMIQMLRSTKSLTEVPEWAILEVARLAPDLAPERSATTVGQDALGETLLFDAVLSVLASPAPPSIIWVDDAQWCDQASASLIGYLANRIDQTRCLLVVGMRSGESATPIPIVDLVRPGQSTTHIHLGSLTVDDLSAVVTDSSQASAVIAQTAGIPLLVSAILAGGEAELGAGVQRFVQALLADLGGLEHQVMTAAAVLDGICDFDLLRSTSGRSDEEVVEAVERLGRHDLLRTEPEGDVSFVIEAVKHLVYERASVVRRRLLHGRAAKALQERAIHSPDARTVAAVARHLQLSGSEREASTWHLRAADLAFEVYAQSEAETSYRLAQALGHPEQTRIRLSLARLYVLGGRYREARAEYETAAAGSDSHDLARAEHGIAEVHRRLGRLDLAAQHFRRAEPDHPEPGSLYADWALLAHRQGDASGAMDLARRSLEAAERSGDGLMTARAHHLLGIVTPDFEESKLHFQRALDHAGEDPGQRMASLNGLAWGLGQAGEHAAAMELVEEALDLARRIGDRHRQAALLNHLADVHYATGDKAHAEELVTESVQLFSEIEPDSWEPEVWLLTTW